MQKEDAEYIHLLNMAGAASFGQRKNVCRNSAAARYKSQLSPAEKPVSAVMYPEGKPLAFTYKNGTVICK